MCASDFDSDMNFSPQDFMFIRDTGRSGLELAGEERIRGKIWVKFKKRGPKRPLSTQSVQINLLSFQLETVLVVLAVHTSIVFFAAISSVGFLVDQPEFACLRKG